MNKFTLICLALAMTLVSSHSFAQATAPAATPAPKKAKAKAKAAAAPQKAKAPEADPVAAPAPRAAPAEAYVPWGMGGCSIWNYAIKDKEKGPQIGVWVLEHLVFGVQTFAISSGTSNCVAGGSEMAQNEQEVFVTVNLAELQKEAAQGKGQHLSTLAEIFGCDDKDGFAQMSQSRYESIFTNENPSNVIQSYKSEIKANKALCSRAG